MKEEDAKIRESIRKRLIQCRTENNLTQTEIGKVVGKSKNAVASWEQGLSLPDIMTLYRLAVFYERSLEYMYGEDE
jgi:transcriptional regulator with XRE-family HTH domain